MTEPQLSNQDIQSVISCFQNGEWEEGQFFLNNLLKEYPDNPELLSLRKEFEIRAKIDQDEKSDQKTEYLKRFIKGFLLVALVVMIIVAVIWGVRESYSWILDQWSAIYEEVSTDSRVLEIDYQVQNAQAYLNSGRPEEAIAIVKELETLDLGDEVLMEINLISSEAEAILDLQNKYEVAILLLQGNDIGSAKAIFEEIYNIDPSFQDVALQLQEIQNQLFLDYLIEEANRIFILDDWEAAAIQYEEILAISPNLAVEDIEENLLSCYMNIAIEILDKEEASNETLAQAEYYFRKALVLKPRDDQLLQEQANLREKFKERLFNKLVEEARAMLIGQEDSLQTLESAKELFAKALALRPNSPNISREIDLAQRFIMAQINYDKSFLDKAIADLEFIISEEQDYAEGTALQSAYESYFARGELLVAGGSYEDALNDFQRSAELAQLSDGILQLYLSKIKIAEIHGVVGDYETATLLYDDAIELINLIELASLIDPDLTKNLEEARRYADIRWFRTSYRLYNRSLPATEVVLVGLEVEVGEGDYLTSLANQYGTSVGAIRDANNLDNAQIFHQGQKIIIPVLKPIEPNE